MSREVELTYHNTDTGLDFEYVMSDREFDLVGSLLKDRHLVGPDLVPWDHTPSEGSATMDYHSILALHNLHLKWCRTWLTNLFEDRNACDKIMVNYGPRRFTDFLVFVGSGCAFGVTFRVRRSRLAQNVPVQRDAEPVQDSGQEDAAAGNAFIDPILMALGERGVDEMDTLVNRLSEPDGPTWLIETFVTPMIHRVHEWCARAATPAVAPPALVPAPAAPVAVPTPEPLPAPAVDRPVLLFRGKL